LSRFAESVHKS